MARKARASTSCRLMPTAGASHIPPAFVLERRRGEVSAGPGFFACEVPSRARREHYKRAKSAVLEQAVWATVAAVISNLRTDGNTAAGRRGGITSLHDRRDPYRARQTQQTVERSWDLTREEGGSKRERD